MVRSVHTGALCRIASKWPVVESLHLCLRCPLVWSRKRSPAKPNDFFILLHGRHVIVTKPDLFFLWRIKETFYPDIPNPENCKALQFQKSLCEVTLRSVCLRLGTRGLLLSVFCEKLVMSAQERSMRKVACFSICWMSRVRHLQCLHHAFLFNHYE